MKWSEFPKHFFIMSGWYGAARLVVCKSVQADPSHYGASRASEKQKFREKFAESPELQRGYAVKRRAQTTLQSKGRDMAWLYSISDYF